MGKLHLQTREEYMADQDTTVTVQNGEKITDKVETTPVEDENIQDQHQEDKTDTGTNDDKIETEDGGENTETQTPEEIESEFKKRFTQLKGETLEEYVKNLEEAYANSSTEGQRNALKAKEADERFSKVAELVAKDPEFAKKLADATGENIPTPQVDPALAWAKDEMEKQYQKEWTDFSELHPEVVTDSELQKTLVDELDLIGQVYEKRTGKPIGMMEGLKKAWISLGYDANDKKDDVVNKTKEQASKPAAQANSKQSNQKPQFTDDQIAVAKKMGLTAEQLAKYYK